TTHAVCVGMTGSGKTGLCIDLLEEAAIDNVPAIIIDPKGDMTNLLLSFPDLSPEDFRPWINVDDARRKDMTEDEFAAQQAQLWRDGLAEWGQDGDRIRMLHEAADFAIYTPGSNAGIPVSILQSFAAPPLSWESEAELLRERIQGAVSALLGLVGVDADPVQSREHILLSSIFEHFWRQGEDLDLPRLILSIQKPPVRKLGVFDVDTFFPEKDRFELAMRINNIIAAPAFESWLQGQPLDVTGFLSTPDGRPRHSIFYIAHLSDAERMFFVTMLLNQVITWMRAQPGTTSLRALLYMDEIFGFFPPVANPPSKQPMLTLLKQARAFGVGVVLTTQNPVDLDYKGLTNAGTWFIGRLQTERDKMRVLDGLESATAQAGHALDRGELSRLISSLGKRVFLLHNVHEEAPVTFQTRWAMSYLRGPLTRLQVRELMEGREPDQRTRASFEETPLAPGKPRAVQPTSAAAAPEMSFAASPPSVSSRIEQVFLPVRKGASTAALDVESEEGGPIEIQKHTLVYVPAVLGMGRLHFVDRTRNVNEREDFALLARPPEDGGLLTWDEAQSLDLTASDLRTEPEPDATFDELPQSINESTEFTALKKNLDDYLYHNSSVTLLHSPLLDVYSHPSETEREFRMRLQQAARERRDEEIDDITERYEKKIDTVEDRLRRKEADLAEREADVAARKRATLVSVGESVLGVFLGRRSTRMASTALSKQRMAAKAKLKVEEAEEDVAELEEDIEELEAELEEEVAELTARWEDSLAGLEEYEVRPRRKDVRISFFGLAWAPHWHITYQDPDGATRTELIEAF
ncbi:MAG: type IV secretion system DNA-binding domain-containing protein, partial [Chloroflexota bacterium]|nr:type IV secretion system DNA-binding domain-containing protein [Chloroflexota bacterium]